MRFMAALSVAKVAGRGVGKKNRKSPCIPASPLKRCRQLLIGRATPSLNEIEFENVVLFRAPQLSSLHHQISLDHGAARNGSYQVKGLPVRRAESLFQLGLAFSFPRCPRARCPDGAPRRRASIGRVSRFLRFEVAQNASYFRVKKNSKSWRPIFFRRGLARDPIFLIAPGPSLDA